MKKIFLTIVGVLAFGLTQAQNGDFKIGANLGLPVGDTSNAYSFVIGGNLSYSMKVLEGLNIGATAGYMSFLGKEYEGHKVKNASFMPIAATAQLYFNPNIFAGLDFGYAVALAPEGSKSGLLYQPKLGYQMGKIDFTLGYLSISRDGLSTNAMNLGVNIRL